MAAIETSGLTKHYGDIVAVDDLDLVVEEGEAFGFLGPNGAGKSTTIDLLLGFLTPTRGNAEILGHDVESESKTVREQLGVLPEGASTYSNLTGIEHVDLAIEMKGGADETEELLEYVGLSPEDWDRPVGGYSKGMRQRLALGMALVGDPEMLLLDEPSSGLDPSGIRDIRNIIEDQVDAGRTVFFSSHILSEVESVCERVGIMRDGTLVTVDEVEKLRAATVGDAEIKLRVETVPNRLNLSNIDNVSDVRTKNDTIRATCSTPSAKISVINQVDEEVEITDVVAEDTSLETVFNTYVQNGRSEATGDSP
ncbi:ABC transporter ATP-binding protein [Halorussus sp. MSC15.2]|uniref:ABC transporter ATP-binding protein n=1 Tax=Halorussus sp. MSC15.2 TaxID=2283638 RepID=UPI0013D51DFF|nr:ABC transporter ATP-binding protein [Halorussus sp. MSC15.2]NEU58558.1 ABC transporter ATP-binding protein [Halorussus sp. MSC15.2]